MGCQKRRQSGQIGQDLPGEQCGGLVELSVIAWQAYLQFEKEVLWSWHKDASKVHWCGRSWVSTCSSLDQPAFKPSQLRQARLVYLLQCFKGNSSEGVLAALGREYALQGVGVCKECGKSQTSARAKLGLFLVVIVGEIKLTEKINLYLKNRRAYLWLK